MMRYLVAFLSLIVVGCGGHSVSPPTPPIPQGRVSITFDDGYQSAYDAAPILDAAGLKATYYIITQALDKPNYMTTSEVKLLASRGHEIGSHTRTHPYLPTLTLAQQEDEIGGSMRDFAAMGLHPTSFAYPFGEFNDNTIIALKEAGFATARTTNSKASGKNPRLLPGLSLGSKTTIGEVKAAIDDARHNGTWLILVFHRVNERGDDAINVSRRFLRQTVDYLVRNKVNVVTVGKATSE